jgi:hypothetical protein
MDLDKLEKQIVEWTHEKEQRQFFGLFGQKDNNGKGIRIKAIAMIDDDSLLTMAYDVMRANPKVLDVIKCAVTMADDWVQRDEQRQQLGKKLPSA